MKNKKGKNRLSKAYKFLNRNDTKVEIISLLSLIVFSSIVFYILKNWDMVVRILNARHMFYSGYYYEPMRAVFESFVIGLFSFISKPYAVYLFIAFVSLVFFLSVWYFTRGFKLDFALLFMFVLSPFVLYYGIKNGSDLLVIAFIIFYAAAIIKKKPIFAGFFLALAFLSKSYALIFAPLLLFLLWDKKRAGIVNFLMSIAIAFISLIPYFIYNLMEYGNLFYSIAMSYLYFHIFSSYISFSLSISHFESIPLVGFIEIVFPFTLIVLFYFRDKKQFYLKIMRNKRIYSILSAAVFLSFLVYFSTSNLMRITGLSIFRFMLPLSIFSYIIAFSFMQKKDMKFVYPVFAISLILAVIILYLSIPSAMPTHSIKAGVSLFNSFYSGKCTVSSNEWVYLDYSGLYAVPPLSYINNYTGTILNFGPANTTLPLVKREGDIYLYGYKNCSFYPSINESRVYEVIHEENISTNPCYWLFGIKPRIIQFYSACNSINFGLLKALK
ncbi:MAG: ArnT family glycosyltransferase [Candidatus Parvarchaeum sp.]